MQPSCPKMVEMQIPQLLNNQVAQISTLALNPQQPNINQKTMPCFSPSKNLAQMISPNIPNKPLQVSQVFEVEDKFNCCTMLRYILTKANFLKKKTSQEVYQLQNNADQAIPIPNQSASNDQPHLGAIHQTQSLNYVRFHDDDEPILTELVKQKDKKTRPYDLENSLQLQIKAKQKIIKLNSKDSQLLPVVVNLRTKELDEDQEGDRSPIDLVCVIDISGSMRGEKIALVRQTLMSLLEVLSERDRLCLVQFDDRAERLTPLLRNSKQNFEVFAQKINHLDSRGGTSIADGMQLAFRVLKDRRYSNSVSSIFLLTDGLDNGADKRVQEHMISLGFLSTNFTIHCFGFGRDHDEDLLNNISNIKDGSFYFIDKLDTVDECFASALGGLMSVVALDVNIYVTNTALKPFQNVKIKKTFGKMWVQKGATSGHTIGLTQLLAGSEKGYLMEVEIPPMNLNIQDKERSQCVLSVYLTAKEKSGAETIKKQEKLILHFINQKEKIGEIEEDGEVLEHYFRVKSAQAIQQAIKLSNGGKYKEGSNKISSIMKQISSNKNVNQTKMKPLIQKLAQSEDSCKPEKYSSAGGRKTMVESSQCLISQGSMPDFMMYSNKQQSRMMIQRRNYKTASQLQ